ncbi:MAG: M28 family peptidase [Sediminibacterium sp.]|nr:M28 family peptidase [Sediminibacterium sp.]
MKNCFLIIGLFFLVSSKSQTNQTNVYQNLMNAVTEAQLKATLSVIAADSMEGREMGTPGENKAANFIANEFKKMGLPPVSKMGYFLPFKVYKYEFKSSSFNLRGTDKLPNNDFIYNINYPLEKPIEIESALNFMNDNILDTNLLNGIKGRVLLIKRQTNANVIQTFIDFLRRKGALGCIQITDDLTTINNATTSNLTLVEPSNSFFVLYVSKSVYKDILGSTKILNDKYLQEVPVPMIFKFECTSINISSKNVMALLKGKTKPWEFVFITSHYDHLGKQKDVIYNGADDDGSGTAALIEIARIFSNFKAKGILPDRTIVFLANSGEEKGLLGSQYYTSNPLLPLQKTSVDLNIDMIGRADPDFEGDKKNYIYIIGDDKLSSQLVQVVDSVNNNFLKMELNRKYNDVDDPSRLFYRSDHYNFAKFGVPVLFYFGGLHEDYHQPSDKIDKIDFKLLKIRTQLILLTAWQIANKPTLLDRDLPLYSKQ